MHTITKSLTALGFASILSLGPVQAQVVNAAIAQQVPSANSQNRPVTSNAQVTQFPVVAAALAASASTGSHSPSLANAQLERFPQTALAAFVPDASLAPVLLAIRR